MSKYTTELRFIYKTNPNEVIEAFSSYEIKNYLTQEQETVLFKNDQWSKLKLANKIINNYYFREIGFETWGRFKHYTMIEMEKIMEHYLPLLYSRAIEYDPLVNVDYTETYKSQSSGENKSNGTESSEAQTNSNSKNKFSDTPNVGLQNIETDRYLTTVNLTNSDATSSGSSTAKNNSTSTGFQTYSKTIKGNSGVSATAQRMVEQFRDNIIAIDAKIIAQLNPLFMGLY